MSNSGKSTLALTGAAVLTALLTGCGPVVGAGSSAQQSTPGTGGAAVSGSTTGGSTSGGSTTGGSSSGGSTTGGQTSASGAATGTASGSGGAATTPAAATGSTRCTVSQLKATVGPNDPGAGQEYFPIVLTNVSSRNCTVYGYPGVELDDASHHSVTPDPQRVSGLTKKVVTLAPGGSAWALLSFSNPAVSGAASVTPAYIVITPPDETHSLTLSWTGGEVPQSGTASTIHVGVFAPGTGA